MKKIFKILNNRLLPLYLLGFFTVGMIIDKYFISHASDYNEMSWVGKLSVIFFTIILISYMLFMFGAMIYGWIRNFLDKRKKRHKEK